MSARVAPPGATPAHVAATAHVFVERLDDHIVVEGSDGHHLQRARRIRVGETITAADGYGRWRVFTVAISESGRIELVATSALVHEARLTPGLTVACALTKGEKPELVVQKLTELGVDRVLVVQAARSVVRWDDERTAIALERLRRVAREAAAQSRRARVAVVEGPVTPAELAAMPGLLIGAPDGVPAHDLPVPPEGEWVAAVGPEGGFDPAELAMMGPVPRLAVGPFVLRAETAAIAVAAALAGRRGFRPIRPRSRPPESSHSDDRREW